MIEKKVDLSSGFWAGGHHLVIPLGKWVSPVGQDLSETLLTSALAGVTGSHACGASRVRLSCTDSQPNMWRYMRRQVCQVCKEAA